MRLILKCLAVLILILVGMIVLRVLGSGIQRPGRTKDGVGKAEKNKNGLVCFIRQKKMTYLFIQIFFNSNTIYH